mgnify:CR=1 FL=1|tara:strand:- start:28 stop:426 length:399 start_codon:yes stop_codon:yes gene_type:complete
MSTLRTNALEGVDAKNSITIVAGAGNITTTNVQEGLCKAWIQYSPNTTNDSFNVSGTTDNGTGDHTMTVSSAMANGNYCFGACGSDHSNNARHIFHEGANPSTTEFRTRTTNSSNSSTDSSFQSMSMTGDLA